MLLWRTPQTAEELRETVGFVNDLRIPDHTSDELSNRSVKAITEAFLRACV